MTNQTLKIFAGQRLFYGLNSCLLQIFNGENVLDLTWDNKTLVTTTANILRKAWGISLLHLKLLKVREFTWFESFPPNSSSSSDDKKPGNLSYIKKN